jgi:hypothetical protein
MRVDGQLHAQAALPPGKRPVTHCIGGWMGPRASLEGCEKSRPDSQLNHRYHLLRLIAAIFRPICKFQL